jgi:hypothetical protein
VGLLHLRPLRHPHTPAATKGGAKSDEHYPSKWGQIRRAHPSELSQELTDLDTRYDREKKAQRRTIAAAKARPEDFAIDKSNAAVTSDARTRGDRIAADPEQR